MKTPIRQRWALLVERNSRSRALPYICLALAVIVSIMDFSSHSDEHYFTYFMIILTVVEFERLGFAELLAAKDREIQRLQHENKPSA